MTRPPALPGDLVELVDDVEQIAPVVLLALAAGAGIAGTGGLAFLAPPFLIFRGLYLELVLSLSNLVSWM
jgi:hypothetical protein